jgi:hypothetical protein
MRCMRAISVLWSTLTSDANLNTVSSCAAPWLPNSCSTIATAPRWCRIMLVRKSRSNAGPRASSSAFICSAVSMPGIGAPCAAPCCMPGMSCCMPAMSCPAPAFASGTGLPRSRSHCCMIAISSCWALMIRSASVRTDALPACVGARRDISMACAWWPIIADMKCTSATVYG